MEIVETYDRSGLILAAVDNLKGKLVEEFIVVALVCLVFLFHLRSALVAIVSLPLGILTAFIVMSHQGINANIMSLGGIAIAIGAMVDAAIVMIENAHKHLERAREGREHALDADEHWAVIARAATEVGPALFFSLLIITLSFLPVFTLEAQEGRLFAPLAFTKTYAMAAAAGLAVTLVPVLMGYLIRGRIPSEQANPLSRVLIAGYRPLLAAVLRWPRTTVALSLVLVLTTLIPIQGISGLLAPLKWPFQAVGLVLEQGPHRAAIARIDAWQQGLAAGWRETFKSVPALAGLAQGLGSEFMPPLDEGDLLYMPTTLPGISIGKAQELLQQTDRLIATVPEVERVFGKIGRAETATDPAPLNMIETTIRLKPRSQWRPGLTLDGLIAELDAKLKIPGVTNAWVMPIRTRIDMLATGIKTPVGIKVAGPDLAVIERIGRDLERVVLKIPGTASAFSDRVAGGRYIEIRPDRLAAARVGLNIGDINAIVAAAVGGINITETVEGLERYPVNLRFPREERDDLDELRDLPIVTPTGAQVPLGQVAEVKIVDGPPDDPERERPAQRLDLRRHPRARSGQLYRRGAEGGTRTGPVAARLFHRLVRSIRIHAASGEAADPGRAGDARHHLPPALSHLPPGGRGAAGHALTALRTGRRLLAGLSARLQPLGGGGRRLHRAGRGRRRVRRRHAGLSGQCLEAPDRGGGAARRALDQDGLKSAIMEGAVMRVRPKAMTVATIFAGLLPIMLGAGVGSEVMRRIAAPMVGGMITAPLLSLFVIPAVYLLWRGRGLST